MRDTTPTTTTHPPRALFNDGGYLGEARRGAVAETNLRLIQNDIVAKPRVPLCGISKCGQNAPLPFFSGGRRVRKASPELSVLSACRPGLRSSRGWPSLVVPAVVWPHAIANLIEERLELHVWHTQGLGLTFQLAESLDQLLLSFVGRDSPGSAFAFWVSSGR